MVDFNRDNTLPRDIVDEMRESYLNYSMSVIVSRALPDVRDGLKPVHRRILYGMNELGSGWNRPYKKSARIVGDVLGKYHPHGDSSVYDALVRMAQNFSMRYELVDGQGNFGSIDGDNAAAMRYTESRMTRLSSEMLKDLDKETVDWGLNFDETLKEPTVLPTTVPTLLINGSEGIAVGVMAALEHDDWITSTYRNHGHAIAKNVSLKEITAEIYGRKNGICKGRGGSMHISDFSKGMLGSFGIVAAGPPIAIGAALSLIHI